MPTKPPPAAPPDAAPDQRVLTARQAQHLAQEAHLEVDRLQGRTIADIEELLKWRIDPHLLLFRKICGRVVRTDPVTHAVEGVPNATVHVLDTDTSFLGYFPGSSPWWWHWPLWTHTEEIGTTRTDGCGRFCVWIPRWDIDRILQFRRKRICFDDVYRPNIRDVLDDIDWGRYVKEPKLPVPPNPPDPPPFDLGPLADFELHHLPVVAERLGDHVASAVRVALANTSFGTPTRGLESLLQQPAFGGGLQPPGLDDAVERLADALPTHVRERYAEVHGLAEAKGKKAKKGEDETFDSAILDRLDVARFRGPFRRCIDLIVAEWTTVLDVPDITFRVTQDVDGDGDEEVIYHEGIFDVRWNAGPMGPTILQASPIARSVPSCDGPVIVCDNTPAIRAAGAMPLEPTHHDLATGLATRVNRPHPTGSPSGAPSYPAASPYAGTVLLHGCHRILGATNHRLVYDFTGTDGTTQTDVPFTGVQWWAARLSAGGPYEFVPDPQGWYTADPTVTLTMPDQVLNWETWRYPDGRYDVWLELADAAKNLIASSPKIAFDIDNSSVSATFLEVAWDTSLGGAFADVLPDVCPIIVRPTGADLYLRVRWSVSAKHLLTASLGASGCGGGSPQVLEPPDSPSPSSHWHTNANDNSITRTGIVRIPSSAPPGCYDLAIDAWGRQFNPAGDGSGPASNWLVDLFYSGSFPRRGIAVIDP